jgi:hypothetical protein
LSQQSKTLWPTAATVLLAGAWWLSFDTSAVAWWWDDKTNTCSSSGVVRILTQLVNKNMKHVGKDDGLNNSTFELIEGDHATIDAIRTVQAGNPISGYTCAAFAHGVNADGSLFDKGREHVSFEYTVQPLDNNPQQFVVELRRW